jgi:hypothetical protein
MSETKFSPPPEGEYSQSAETKASKPSDAPSLFSRFKTGVKEAPRNVANLAGRGTGAVKGAVKEVAHKTTEVAGNAVDLTQANLRRFKDGIQELSTTALEGLKAQFKAERKEVMVTAVLDALRSKTGKEVIDALPFGNAVVYTLEALVGKSLEGKDLGLLRRAGKFTRAGGSAVLELAGGKFFNKAKILKSGSLLGIKTLSISLRTIGEKLKEKGDSSGASMCEALALYLETKIKLS